MHLLDRKVWREIRTQKFRSILIASIVAVTIALIIGMRSGDTMVLAS